MTDPKKTTSTPTLVREIPIPLAVPLPVKDADGKAATRDMLVMRRPNFAQAKALSLIIGPQFVKALMDNDSGDETKVDMSLIVQEVIAALTSANGLEGLTGIIADMCGESVALIDQLDWLDLLPIARAFLGFFPQLQSIARTKSGLI